MLEFDILLPPILLETEFADRIAKIEEQKALAAKENSPKSEACCQSLRQEASKGELN